MPNENNNKKESEGVVGIMDDTLELVDVFSSDDADAEPEPDFLESVGEVLGDTAEVAGDAIRAVAEGIGDILGDLG